MKKDSAAVLLVVAADQLTRHRGIHRRLPRRPAGGDGGRDRHLRRQAHLPRLELRYIRPQPTSEGTAVCKVEAFVEKPDAATAGALRRRRLSL
jgi:mannose-1-phosphate guanylyltransferase